MKDPQLRRIRPDLKQARVERYADTRLEDYRDSKDQELFFQYSQILSGVTNLDRLPEELPDEVQDAVRRHKERYVRFLREERKQEDEFVGQNVRTYKEHFVSPIQALKEHIDEKGGHGQGVPGYLGSGAVGSAYAIEVDGVVYAAKLHTHVGQANFELKPLLRAKGIPHTAQLAAYSLPDHVVIMELLPGKPATEVTDEEVPSYDDATVIQLIDTARSLHQKGIVIDSKPSNFLFDPKEGFSVLDFHLLQWRTTMAEQVMALRTVLSTRKSEPRDWSAPDYAERYAGENLKENKRFLQTLVQLLTILRNQYPEIIEEWKQHRQQVRSDPSISGGQLVQRKEEYRSYKDPDIDAAIATLESMEDEYIFS